MKGKHVLITGALGFVGSYCLDKYRKEGWRISVIDSLVTNAISKDYLKDGETFHDCDVLKYKWNRKDKFDLIVHLASPVGPAGILKHAGQMARQIIDDVYWAIDGANTHQCPLIFVSTSEIYGYRDRPLLLKEEDDKVLVGSYKVRNEYSMAKLVSEVILSNVSKVSNLKYQIIRPFNISGARQLPDGGFVLPTFVKQALANEDITVFGDGSQIRAFTHVKDIVDGIYLTSTCPDSLFNEAWNVGNPNNRQTIFEMAKKVKQLTRSESQIIFVDPKTIHGPLYEEAWDKVPHPGKIQELLGWSPKFNVNDILNDVISYYG